MVHASHDHFLVALSLLIAGTAAYTALDLAGRIKVTSGWVRRGWLAASAVAMGGGIWSMHFVAMLAMSLPGIDVIYKPGLTALSILLAIIVTGPAIAIVSTHGPRPVPLAQSALFMGTGIVAMHYTGMAALHLPLTVSYDALWIAVSAVVAIAASGAALWLAFGKTGARLKLGAALVMGLAISGMHYSGMAGISFHESDPYAAHVYATGLNQSALALAVAGTTFVILFFALIASLFDRRFAELAEREAIALRRSEEAFRALYRRTPLPLHTLDAEGRIEYASDAWLELLGYEIQQVVGQPFTRFTAPGQTGEDCFHLENLLAAGEVRDLECRLIARSGDVLDVLISGRVERDEEGRICRTLCGLVDVTAHRRAEKALRQAQKMEALGQLTGGVAHDFNNLLAVVVGNLDRLRRHLGSKPDALALAENAAFAAERGVALTQRMLAFARQQKLMPEATDLITLLSGMSDLLRQSLGPEISLDIDLPAHLPPVQADPIQLELALLNLAVNSRDAMPNGGTITISANASTSKQDVPSELAPGSYVCISVKDDGEGMDQRTLACARDPFFTTKGLGKGTGLGLSMVHGFAEQSSGALRLTSCKGYGSTAEIWLSVAEVVVTARTARLPTELSIQAPVSALTVIAVDDDALVLMNTSLLLTEIGHHVIEAASGAQALEILKSNASVDLLITDQGMPDMTGTQLAAEVRKLWPCLPIIIATGYAEIPGGEAYVRLGKPFDARSLAAAIGCALDQPQEGAVLRAVGS